MKKTKKKNFKGLVLRILVLSLAVAISSILGVVFLQNVLAQLIPSVTTQSDYVQITGKLCLNGTGPSDCITHWSDIINLGVPQPAQCGNNLLESPEYCDGTIIPETCASLGFAGGSVSCNTNCTFDTSGCVRDEKKYVFTTSGTFKGRISYVKNNTEYVGLDAANLLCNDLAELSSILPVNAKPSHGASYRAWLATPSYSPDTVFNKFNGPYYLTSNPEIKIADNWADLTDGSLDAPINKNQNGNAVSAQVWTGTKPNGKYLASCGNNWDNKSQVVFARNMYMDYGIGTSTKSDTGWSYFYSARVPSVSQCSFGKALYCFQQ